MASASRRIAMIETEFTPMSPGTSIPPSRSCGSPESDPRGDQPYRQQRCAAELPLSGSSKRSLVRPWTIRAGSTRRRLGSWLIIGKSAGLFLRDCADAISGQVPPKRSARRKDVPKHESRGAGSPS